MGRVSFADNVQEQRAEEVKELATEAYTVYKYEDDKDNKSWAGALPKKQGLYDPELEKDACGVGFAAHIKGKASHKIVTDGLSKRSHIASEQWLISTSSELAMQHDPPWRGWFRRT